MSYPANYLASEMHVETPRGIRKSTLYWGVEGNVMPTEYNHLKAASNAVFTMLSGTVPQLLDETSVLRRVKTRVRTNTLDMEAASTLGAVAGSNAVTVNTNLLPGDWAMPDEAALVIRKVVEGTGHANKGRLFISGLTEKINFGGKIDDDFAAGVIAFADALTAPITVSYTPDAEEDPNGTAYNQTFLMRHWNRKDNVFKAVVKCVALDVVGTRKDRRRNLQYQPIVMNPSEG